MFLRGQGSSMTNLTTYLSLELPSILNDLVLYGFKM